LYLFATTPYHAWADPLTLGAITGSTAGLPWPVLANSLTLSRAAWYAFAFCSDTAQCWCFQDENGPNILAQPTPFCCPSFLGYVERHWRHSWWRVFCFGLALTSHTVSSSVCCWPCCSSSCVLNTLWSLRIEHRFKANRSLFDVCSEFRNIGRSHEVKPWVSNSNCSENQIRTYKVNPRAALWRWRNNGCTWSLLETAFKSYFLRKVSWVNRQIIFRSLYVRLKGIC